MNNRTIDTIEVFGMADLPGRIPELLKIDVENKYNPYKWNWKPFLPEKIARIKEIVEAEKAAVDFTAITNYHPQPGQREKVILIFANGNLTYGLVEHCKEYGLNFFMLDYTKFILEGTVSVSHGNGGAKKVLRIQDVTLDLDDVAAVLWNPPLHIRPIVDSLHLPPSEEDRHKFMFKKRWIQLLRDLIHLLPEGVLWLPGDPFEGSQDWQNKIGEYNLASRMGLNIPPYIFTNSESELSEFVRQNQVDRLLLREFSTPPFSFPPIRLSEDHKFDNLETSPCCFQKYIEKEYELRVIVLLDKVFPCKINSQDSPLAKHDWRVHDDAYVKWEITDIPQELADKLIVFCQKLNLNWASVDLIYSTDKKYYFLEANRPGAHYWLHGFIGLDITKEIALSLKEKLYFSK